MAGQSFGRTFAAALVLAMVLGALSFGITRFLTDEPAGDRLARNTAESTDSTRRASEADGLQQHQQMLFLQQLRDSLKNDSLNPDLMVNYANALYDASLFKSASEVYQRYLTQIDSSNANARIDYAFTLFQQGMTDSALFHTQKALAFEPEHPIAMYNLGIIYVRMEQPAKAREWLERCILAADSQAIGANARRLLDLLAEQQQKNQ